MYRWYGEAAVCLVHLEDVDSLIGSDQDSPAQFAMLEDLLDASRPPPKWMTRGWTLQELIAPNELIFYDKYWHRVGSKASKATLNALHNLTSIPVEILLGTERCTNMCVALRMQWASGRRTTRREDEAYCLLGLFDVNMPLLYGEGGKKAFLRLQEAIMRTHNDHTIFAWRQEGFSLTGNPVLAESPADFQESLATHSRPAIALKHNHNYLDAIFSGSRMVEPPFPFNLTNTGLQIRLPISFTPSP